MPDRIDIRTALTLDSVDTRRLEASLNKAFGKISVPNFGQQLFGAGFGKTVSDVSKFLGELQDLAKAGKSTKEGVTALERSFRALSASLNPAELGKTAAIIQDIEKTYQRLSRTRSGSTGEARALARLSKNESLLTNLGFDTSQIAKISNDAAQKVSGAILGESRKATKEREKVAEASSRRMAAAEKADLDGTISYYRKAWRDAIASREALFNVSQQQQVQNRATPGQDVISGIEARARRQATRYRDRIDKALELAFSAQGVGRDAVKQLSVAGTFGRKSPDSQAVLSDASNKINTLQGQLNRILREGVTGETTQVKTIISLYRELQTVLRDATAYKDQLYKQTRPAGLSASAFVDPFNNKGGRLAIRQQLATRTRDDRETTGDFTRIRNAQVKAIQDTDKAAAKAAADEVSYQNSIQKELEETQAALVRLNELQRKSRNLSVHSGGRSKELREFGSRLADLRQFVESNGTAGSSFRGGQGGTDSAGNRIVARSGNAFGKNQFAELSQVLKTQNALNRQIELGANSARKFGEQIGLAFKRFAAFTVGAAPIFIILSQLRLATQEALKFEANITKIEQVLNTTSQTAGRVGDAIKEASVATGSAVNDIADAVQTLAQAGITDPLQLASISKELAKIPLAATFDDIKSTTEGLIAIFGQFDLKVGNTAEILDIVNQYAADFAVESQDIFDAVKRGGAAFATAGGSFQEFVELFSLLRSSTRESAESLGNFFKTGFASLLTFKSQGIFELLGISEVNDKGEIKTLIDQIYELSTAMESLQNRGKIRTAEELVGSRQFNRLTSLLKAIPSNQDQLAKSRSNVTGSLDTSISKRLDDVGVSLQRVQQAITDFVTTLTQNEAFKEFVKFLADIAIGFSEIGKAIAPVLPLLATVAGALIAKQSGRGITSGILGKFGFDIDRISRNRDSVFQNALDNGFSPERAGLRADRFAFVERGRSRRQALSNFGRSAIGFGGAIGAGIAADLIGGRLQQSSNRGLSATGGALSGAATGGTIGFALGGPVGAGIGAFVGAVGGATKSLYEFSEASQKARAEAAKTLEERASIENEGIFGGTFDGFLDALDTVGTNVSAIFGDMLAAAGDGVTALLEFSQPLIDFGATLYTDYILPFNDAMLDLINSVIPLSNIFDLLGKKITQVLSLIPTLGVTGAVAATAIQSSPTATAGVNAVAGTNANTDAALSAKIVGELFEGNSKNSIRKIFGEEQLRILSQNRGNTNITKDEIQQQISAAATARITKIVEAEFKRRGSGSVDPNAVSAEVQRRIVNDTTGQFISPKSAKQIEKSLDRNQFTGAADKLAKLFFDFAGKMTEVFEGLNKKTDELDNIITDRNGISRVASPTDNQTLLRSRGFDGLAAFRDDTRRIVEQFKQLFSLPGAFEGKRSAQDAAEASGEGRALKDIPGSDLLRNLLGPNVTGDIVKKFNDLLNQLAVEAGKDVGDVFKTLIESGGDLEATINKLRGGEEIYNAVSEAIRKQIELENKKLEQQKTLLDNVRSLAQVFFELNQQITSSKDSLQDRVIQQSQFVNDRGGVQAALENAGEASRRAARSSFGNQGGFIQSILQASRDVNAARSGGLRNNFDDAQKDLQTQSRFADLQQELGQRLSELNNQISSAASATDILRDAFLSFREDIRSAGAAVTGFTIKDLGRGFDAIRSFQKGGVEGLNDQKFESLQRILGVVGNLQLGNGLSGNQLLGNLNQDLGLSVIGQIRSLFTGRSAGAESDAAAKELADLKKQQEAAAAVEKALREQQIQLLEAQAQLIPIEQQFYKDQLMKLSDISLQLNELDYIKNMDAKIGKLFDTSLPVTLDKALSRSNSSSNKDNVKNPFTTTPNGLIPSLLPRFPNNNLPPNQRDPLLPGPSKYPFKPIGGQPEPQRKDLKLPAPIDPNDPLGTGRPIRRRFNPLDPTTAPDNNQPLSKGIDTLNNQLVTLSKSLDNYGQTLANMAKESMNTNTGTANFTLDVKPIQVNVAMSAPDILQLAGPALCREVMRQITPAIANAFGVSSEEAKNVFVSSLPQQG